METHLWVYLGNRFQKDLREEGRLTLNVGNTTLQAEEVPRLDTKQKELSTSLPSVSWLQTQPASPAAPSHSLALPTTAGYTLTL